MLLLLFLPTGFLPADHSKDPRPLLLQDQGQTLNQVMNKL